MDERAERLVVVGASAGGVEALTELVGGLPAGLNAAVAVVLHLPAGAQSRLPQILGRAGPLLAVAAEDGLPLERGRIYVAPPDHHLVIRDRECRIVTGPHENGVRPSVDVLFRSAALAYGPGTVGVVLSGARDDGVAGANAIEQRGGCVLVQDPDEAAFSGMPSETLSRDHPDAVLPLAALAGAIVRAVGDLSTEEAMSDNPGDEMSVETEYAMLEADTIGRSAPPGRPSPFTCPACGGVLWESEDDEQLRFRCRVGHAFSAEAAVDEEGAALEDALWTALRALRERADLSDRIVRRLGDNGAAPQSRRRFEAIARESREKAEVIRRVLAGSDRGET